MAHPDQRDATRLKYTASILLENFSAGAHYEAKMHNYSRGGMYFESDYTLQPGSNIYIKVADYRSDPHEILFGDGYQAQVRWCRKIPGIDIARFGMGVQYQDPDSWPVFGDVNNE